MNMCSSRDAYKAEWLLKNGDGSTAPELPIWVADVMKTG
jgi:hypothetical protein